MQPNNEELVDRIARICHEANRAHCVSLGDASIQGWDEAPEWQKHSVRVGVIEHIKNPSISPAQSHENWMSLKLRDGWRYGDTKCAEQKTHPCLLPYGELPDDQKRKDALFKGVVTGMLVPV